MFSWDTNTSSSLPFPSLSYKVPAFFSYIGVGLAAILSNLFVFAILISDRRLLKKSGLLFGVTCAHFLCGLHLVWAGTFRYANLGTLASPVRPWTCVVLVFPDLYPFMFQALAAMLLLAATERLLVFLTPTWFYSHCTRPRAWLATAGVFAFAAISLIGAAWSAWTVDGSEATLECVQPAMFSRGYVSYYLAFSVVGGTLAVVGTIVAFWLGSHRIAKLPSAGGEAARVCRQLQLTKTMLSICVTDFVLVVVPNTVLLFGNIYPVPPAVGNYATLAYGLNAVITILANLYFNGEFRRAARKLRRCFCPANAAVGVVFSSP